MEKESFTPRSRWKRRHLSVLPQVKGEAFGMGCQAGIGVAGGTGPQGCIAPDVGDAGGAGGVSVAPGGCEEAGEGMAGGVAIGVGVNERLVRTVEFCERLSMAGVDVAGAAMDDGEGAVAGGLRCTSARMTSDDKRTRMIARALRSILASQRIIILVYINKMLYIKTIKR